MQNKASTSFVRTWIAALFALAAFFTSTATASASGDIVYSARYYAPPGSRYFTHFHLNRIDSDGAGRRQLTFGQADDSAPVWSTDGREVRFVRTVGHGSKLMSCDEYGRRLRTVATIPAYAGAEWSPDGRYACVRNYEDDTVSVVDDRGASVSGLDKAEDVVFSPGSRYAYVRAAQAGYIVDMVRHTRVRITTAISQGWPDDVAWLNGRQFAGITSATDSNTVNIAVFDVTGKLRRSVPCSWDGSKTDPGAGTVDAGGRGLATDPAGSPFVDYIQDIGTSGTMPDYIYYRCSTQTGVMHEICQGQFLVWGPGHRSFCSSTEHELAQYDRERSVYTTQLFIGRTGSAHDRIIVSGLVWVTDADWRKPRP